MGEGIANWGIKVEELSSRLPSGSENVFKSTDREPYNVMPQEGLKLTWPRSVSKHRLNDSSEDAFVQAQPSLLPSPPRAKKPKERMKK
jgi:hypothetical protein